MSDSQSIPNHVALILDGNRRWARSQGLHVLKGHRTSAENMEALLQRLRDRGVKTTTLWAFSTENWKRDAEQVDGIMNLALEFLRRYRDRVIADEIRVIHLGRKDRLPEDLRHELIELEKDTRNFTQSYLNIAIDYGGRDEILRALHKIHEAGVDVHDLNEENFNTYLDTGDQPYPEPDLIVRPGGALRMSGFMAWQSVYAEFIFTDKLLPDLTPDDIDDFIAEYGDRERRFGGGK